ncbi:hypothetical protein [Candidatus Albibeggiatoa sp. nov. BB20]|uniref:hypothetical protein n=1 Tax=Candidatus Albibeggiatoa sp. nov. BB20 TaxID=3162723 RepID=UPI0033657099
MIANYSLKPSELTSDFIEHLKQMYCDSTINITVIDTEQTQDETAFFLSNPANRTHLLNALENVKNGNTVTVDPSVFDDEDTV